MTRENQQERSRLVREEILNAALAFALEEGFASMSIRKIAAKIGYSTGVIYYHFRDKQEIIDAIQEREGKDLRNTITSALQPDASAMDNLRAVYQQIMLLAFHNAHRYNLLVLQRHGRG